MGERQESIGVTMVKEQDILEKTFLVESIYICAYLLILVQLSWEGVMFVLSTVLRERTRLDSERD